MTDQLSSSSRYIFNQIDGSVYSNDTVINPIDDSSINTNNNLSSILSTQSSEILSTSQMIFPCCICHCQPNSHPFQERCIPLNEQVKIGRAVARLKAFSNNAIFDCKVLSRQHAKIWYQDGKVC